MCDDCAQITGDHLRAFARPPKVRVHRVERAANLCAFALDSGRSLTIGTIFACRVANATIEGIGSETFVSSETRYYWVVR